MASAQIFQLRQHVVDHPFSQHYNSPTSISSNYQLPNLPLRGYNSQYLTAPPAELDNPRLSHSPLSASTAESSPATSTFEYDNGPEFYMQRATQGPQDTNQQQQAVRHPSLDASGLPQEYWTNTSQQPRSAARIRHSIPPNQWHKRTNSDSTINSAPYTPTSFPQPGFQQPFIVESESQQYSPHSEVFDHHNQHITSVPKGYSQLAQPVGHGHQIFAQETQPAYYNDAQSNLQWSGAMREAILHQQQYQGQVYRTMDHRGNIQDTMQGFSKVPGLGPRTISEICQDELYNVAEQIPTSTSITSTPTNYTENQPASPVSSVFSQRLQAANQGHLEAARSASPTTSSFGREKSPLRSRSALTGSPFEPPASPGAMMKTAAQLREVQNAEAAAHAFANAARKTSRESSQTVSPKDVSLELDPADSDNNLVMFGSPPRHSHKKRPSRLNQQLTPTSSHDNLFKTEDSNTSTDLLTPGNNGSIAVPQQYPFIRAPPPVMSGFPESSQESNPRFPSTLISMESTRSERSDHSSAGSSPDFIGETSEEDDTQQPEVARPDNTRSDGGTYTCTYHGCTQRFETPQRLQKHKKEGHRQGTPSTNADSRLTQAGPHKCERTNPQTGKPCNSIFSRPYDLTRHEDTIHNAKKQKVKCHICTEDKTFSRNDALTRHMRVVHPDVEFPGKTKRGSR